MDINTTLDSNLPIGCGCAACQRSSNDSSQSLLGEPGFDALAPPGTNGPTEILSGSVWSNDGNGVTLYYNFWNALPSYYAGSDAEANNFKAFTSQMQTAAEKVLGQIETFTNITFVETSNEGSTHLGFAQATLDPQAGAWAYYPHPNPKGGDVWTNRTYVSETNLGEGSYDFYTLLHEVGHALGLEHTFTAGLTGEQNTEQYSVMAYDWTPWGNTFAESYQLYDIYALQQLYGVNNTYNTGNDTYTLRSGDAYTIWDAGGTDTLDGSALSASMTINLDAGEFSSVGLTRNIAIAYGAIIENAIGGSGNDLIYGNDVNNALSGGDGDDTLDGGAGDDILTGGAGADTYIAGTGDDTIIESSSADINVINMSAGITYSDLTFNITGNNLEIVIAAVGTITIAGQFDAADSGIDTIVFSDASTFDLRTIQPSLQSSEGDDSMQGLAGDDNITALGGNDVVHALDGNDTAHGGDGKDKIIGGAGNDTLYGDAGNDNLKGGIGSDTIYGGTGNDSLRGGTGDDFLYGEAGNDMLYAEAGDDTYDGGTGIDTIRYDKASAAVNVDLGAGQATNNGEGGTDTLANLENIFGSSYDDILTGDANNNYIWGKNGDDIITGGAGDDTLRGGNGADTFIYEAGTSFGNEDFIRDFNTGEGDILDISDILNGFYDPLTDLITDFVRITDDGEHSYVAVDQNGGADNFVQIIELSYRLGLTDEEALETSGNLIA